MFKYFRNLSFMQWYSIGIFSWFAGMRFYVLAHTDNIARAFLANPTTLIIAFITTSYAIMVYFGKNNTNFFTRLGQFLCVTHVYFTAYRFWVFYYHTHSLADFNYLILDIAIATYFILSLNLPNKVIEFVKKKVLMQNSN